MNKIIAVIITVMGLLGAMNCNAQRGAAPAPVASAPEVPSNVSGKGSLLQSHVKSLGRIGKTGRYEIVQVKVRGLDTPNVAGFLIYDEDNDVFVACQTAGAPGLGVAIVNGGATVAGSYLFGSKVRPSNQNINNGSTSEGGSSNIGSIHASGGTGGAGGNSAANAGSAANATGGQGGDAVAGSSSNVVSNNNAAAQPPACNGGAFIPPGHQNNPSHNH